MDVDKVTLALELIASQRFYNINATERSILGITDDLVPFMNANFVRAWCVRVIVNALQVATVEPSTVDTTELTAPEAEAVLESADVTFQWTTAADALTYDLQVDDTDNTFASLVVDETGLEVTEYEETGLSDATYYARVRAVNQFGAGAWSTVVEFEVDAVE